MRQEHEVLAVGSLDTMLGSYLKLFRGREVTALTRVNMGNDNPGVELSRDDDGSYLVTLISPLGFLAINRYRTAEPPTRERIVEDNKALFPDLDSPRPRKIGMTKERLTELLRLTPTA